MSIFDIFRPKQAEIADEPEKKAKKKVKADSKKGQLLQILDSVKSDSKIYKKILQELADRNPEKFKSAEEAQEFFESATTGASALGAAKLIDKTFGAGTVRTLSFLDKGQGNAQSVYKLLRQNIDRTSFEKQVEKGHYLNLLETYGVEWDLEKTARDSLQNFFDANGQTLDGVDVETEIKERKTKDGKRIKTGKVLISAPQDYDWRELVHFGGTTKGGDERAVGGFGEGLKIAAFVALKDHGAKQVRAASRDWELEYYFDNVATQSYGKKVRGLHAKKKKREPEQGNYLEIIFEGDKAEEEIKVFEKARDFFYSSENPDFQGASFDNPETGGFKVLPWDLTKRYLHEQQQKGHLYLAGQRMHFDSRDAWETVEDLNIWTRKKVQEKDRDRGMITAAEVKKRVLPLIVGSMPTDDKIKSVYDFKPLWDKLRSFTASDDLLWLIVNRLKYEDVKLEFDEEYLAVDVFAPDWIVKAMESQGFKLCRGYMKDIGMKSVVEKFIEFQSHSRVEAEPEEAEKIKILQDAARAIGLLGDEIKEVWLFSEKDEKNIFSGQYNGMFYWLSKETLVQDFFEAINTYVHEAAHKEGLHGEAKFEYYLEHCKQKITKFILEHKKEWDELEKKWAETKKIKAAAA